MCRSMCRHVELLRERWTDIQDHLIRTIDVYGIYDGRTFKSERWRNLMASWASRGASLRAVSWT